MSTFWDWFWGTGGGLSPYGKGNTQTLANMIAEQDAPLAAGPAPQPTGLGGLISNTISGIPGRLGSAVNKPTSLSDIMAQLQSLQDASRYAADPNLLRQQAEAQASAQYDPIIAQLRAAESGAQQRANVNMGKLKSMYSGLSQSLMNDVAPIQQQYADTQNKVAAQYSGLQDQIKQQYASSQAEQEAMMKRLGIEAAAPTALQGQQNDLNLLVSNAAQEGQNVQSQLSQQGSGAVDYTRQGAENAQLEGTNRQADLMAALGDYLNQAQGQIGSNVAAKSAAAQSGFLSLMNQSQQNAQTSAQRDFENYIKSLQIMNTLQGSQKQQGAVKSPIDVGPRVMGLGVDTNGAQRIQSAFMSAITNDPQILAAVDPNSGIALSKEALANRVREYGIQQGLSSQEINALHEAALEYFGRQ